MKITTSVYIGLIHVDLYMIDIKRVGGKDLWLKIRLHMFKSLFHHLISIYWANLLVLLELVLLINRLANLKCLRRVRIKYIICKAFYLIVGYIVKCFDYFVVLSVFVYNYFIRIAIPDKQVYWPESIFLMLCLLNCQVFSELTLQSAKRQW